jgi:uncharacterized protein (TIGR00299 family) protein
MRTLVINAAFGASGDMLVSAALDLGLDLDEIIAPIGDLIDSGMLHLSIEKVKRRSVSANYLVIQIAPNAPSIDLDSIRSRAQTLDAPGKALALAATSLLEHAELSVHGSDSMHLHELASLDTLADIILFANSVSRLAIDAIQIPPVGVATGFAQMDHGCYPLPGPATAAILRNSPLYIRTIDPPESLTPTGASLLAALVKVLPATDGPGRVTSVGYGAGTKDPPDRANLVQMLLLEQDPVIGEHEEIAILEVTLDDLTGEELGGVADEALARGALDAWLTPVLGKKGRPANHLSVLCQPEKLADLLAWLHQRTRSPGIRHRIQQRSVLERHEEIVTISSIPVRVKVTRVGAKPEHRDLVQLAQALGINLVEARMRVLKHLGLDG